MTLMNGPDLLLMAFFGACAVFAAALLCMLLLTWRRAGW